MIENIKSALANAGAGVHDVAGSVVAANITKVGAGGAVLGWATNQELLAVIGVVVAVAGFVVQWYYKRVEHRDMRHFRAREDARAQAEHEERMKHMRERAEDSY